MFRKVKWLAYTDRVARCQKEDRPKPKLSSFHNTILCLLMIKCLSDLSITKRVFECKMILIVYMSKKKLVNVPFTSTFMNLMSDLSLI